MKQLTDSDDDSSYSLPSATDVKGLPRALSQRMMKGESDRTTLLKSDSKRSLLVKSLSRSMVKLKNTVTQKGDGDDEEETEEVVSLMEYEMLRAKLHVSEGTVMQQTDTIEHLQMQLSEKDDVIDSLMKKLEAMATANANANTNTNATTAQSSMRAKRMSSLEEKRLKKRQMERAHSLGLTRSSGMLRNGFQALESVLKFGGGEGDSGNPSNTAAADSQSKEPISASNGLDEKNPPLQDTEEHTQESSDQAEAGDRSKYPHRRSRQLTKQSSRRSHRRKNSTENFHNSGSSNNDSQDFTHTPLQSEKRVLTLSATGETTKDRSKSPKDRSPRPRRPQLTKQSSRRNRRKSPMENTEGTLHNSNTSTDANNDQASTPTQTERKALTSSATEETKGGRQTGPMTIEDGSRSPHRRRPPLAKQSSRRNNRRKNSPENTEAPPIATEETQQASGDATRDKSSSASKQSKGRPSRRRPDGGSSPEAARNFRRKLAGDSVNGGENRLMRNSRAQTRSAKAREEMKKNDGDILVPESPRTATRQSQSSDRTESAGDKKGDAASGSRASPVPTAVPNMPIFPATMGKDFKDQGFADFFETTKDPIDDKSQAQDATDGFVAHFGGSPFGTLGVINDDEQQHNAEPHELGQGGIVQFKTSEDSSQEATVASGDNQTGTNGSKHDKSGHSASTADSNAFSTNFSMLSFNMDEIVEDEEKPEDGSSKPNERKSSQATNFSVSSENAIAPDEKGEAFVTGSSKPADETDYPEEVIATAPESLPWSASSPASLIVAQVRKETKPTPSRGRDYLLKMNRTETLGNAEGVSNRSRSLSPGWTSPKTPSGRRKLRIKKEPNLNRDFLKAEFQKNVKKFLMLNDQFQQKALPDLEAEKTVDMRSISVSFSSLGDEVLNDETKRDEIHFPPLSENEFGEIRLPPPPPMSSMSPPLSAVSRKKTTKTVRWELEQNLYRLNLIPVYNQEEKKDCFYNEEEIKKFRFDLVSHVAYCHHKTGTLSRCSLPDSSWSSMLQTVTSIRWRMI